MPSVSRLLAASFVSASLAEEIWCRSGVLVQNVCCDRSCGVCTGPLCSGLCCGGVILRSRGLCKDGQDVSCIVPAPLDEAQHRTSCRDSRWASLYNKLTTNLADLHHVERYNLHHTMAPLVFKTLRDPLDHLARCRPIGLLLLLYHIRLGVHFFPDALIAQLLAEYSLCRAGSADHCEHIASVISGTLSVDAQRIPRIYNASSLPALHTELMSERRFLFFEDQVEQALRDDLRVVSSIDFPEANSVVLEPSSTCNLFESEEKFYSQHGEDGVLRKLFQCIGVLERSFVEIGTQTGRECNTRYLRVAGGFSGYMFDNQNEDSRINLIKATVTPDNAFELLSASVGPASLNTLDLLSIDTDGGDYGIWNAICDRVKPRVVVVEALKEVETFHRLGSSCGYSLVYYIVPNMFFLRLDLLQRWSQGSFPHADDLYFFVKREDVRWTLYNSLSITDKMQASYDAYSLSSVVQLHKNRSTSVIQKGSQMPTDVNLEMANGFLQDSGPY